MATSTPTNTLITVLTSGSDVHQRWRVTGVGTASLAYAIDMVDESDTTLFSVAGGFPLSMAEPGTRNFNSSESRTGFLIAGNYGSRAFGDASLIGYDSATRSATTLGTLPGTADFGGDAVYAGVNGGPGAVGLGFAARSSGGVVQEAGAKVFSFDLGVANSLKFTTTQQ